MKRWTGWLATAVLVAGLTACARPGVAPAVDTGTAGAGGAGVAQDSISAPNPGPVRGDDWPGCTEVMGAFVREAWSNTAIDWPALPADFNAVRAVQCSDEMVKRSDGGTDEVLVERSATDIGALVGAYRLPSRPTGSGACRAMLVIPPDIALIDAAGQWVRPKAPTNECGQPRQEVIDAAGALHGTEVSRTVIREIESAAAAASGCGMSWADMISVETTDGHPVVKSAPMPPNQAMRLCTFSVPAKERGTSKPGGAFVSGRVLTAAEFGPLRSAIGAAGPAVACSTHAGKFALIRRATDNGGLVYIELDGCRRIMTELITEDGLGSNVLSQGDAALTALVQAR